MLFEIEPRSGTAVRLYPVQLCVIIDRLGEQVADPVAFNQHKVSEALSPMTACAAARSNTYCFKPVHFELACE